jgi:hypothetical protein
MQIWAANDIRIFVRLMVQRNVEIQLQALDLIERRQASKDEGDDNPVESEIETKEIEKFVEAEINVNNHSIDEQGTDDKFKRLNLFFEQERIKTADVEQRKEYLRTQRDKILQIKKQARARQLNEATKEASTTRATSAKAARKIIDGDESYRDVAVADDSSFQLRKMLARKLREEVVDKASYE